MTSSVLLGCLSCLLVMFVIRKMRMIGARGLPSSLCNDVEARWSFWDQDMIQTPAVEGPTTAPDFEYVTQFYVNVNRIFCDYVASESLEVEIWGKPTDSGFLKIRSNSSDDSSETTSIRRMPKTVPELQAALKQERIKRKDAENRLAELTTTSGGRSSSNSSFENIDMMRKEILQLKKKLEETPKSSACSIQ